MSTVVTVDNRSVTVVHTTRSLQPHDTQQEAIILHQEGCGPSKRFAVRLFLVIWFRTTKKTKIVLQDTVLPSQRDDIEDTPWSDIRLYQLCKHSLHCGYYIYYISFPLFRLGTLKASTHKTNDVLSVVVWELDLKTSRLLPSGWSQVDRKKTCSSHQVHSTLNRQT